MAGFSIGSKELKKVISQIEPVLKGGIDNLPRILFAVNDKVSAKATNGDSYVDIVFDCDIISKGSFVVPGNLLANVVNSAPFFIAGVITKNCSFSLLLTK